MMETLEYIEAYFQQTLGEEERQHFQERCEKDEAFAKEVAFYITSRQLLKEELLKQKQTQWQASDNKEEKLPAIAPVKKLYQRKWFMYAAACFILAVSVYLFERSPTTEQLAKQYITNTYTQLSQTMDGDLKDSLQLGIASYNNKDYKKALEFFTAVAQNYPDNSDAKKYAGLVYLQTMDYDKALQKFDELAAMKGLFSNAGDFMKALTLLQRRKAGDSIEAKRLLQKVVAEHEEGSQQAADWLKKM